MASRSDIEAGAAFVRLSLKDQLSRPLKEARQTLNDFASNVMRIGLGVTAIGAAITTSMFAAVMKFAEMGGMLDDVSQRTGLSASTLAEFKFAAEMSAASIADIEKAIISMQKKGLTSTFDQVADEIAKIADPAERTRAAFEAWGESGVKLMPMLNQLAELRQEARDLGLVPSEAAVQAAAEFGDAMDKVKMVFGAVVFEIGAALAPILQPVLELTIDILAAVAKWVREHQTLAKVIFVVGAALVVVGGVITAIGATILGIMGAVAAISSFVAFVGTPLGLALVAIAAIAFWLALWVGSLIAAGVYFFKFTEIGRSVVASLKSLFGEFFAFLGKGWSTVIDALLSGEFALAATAAAKMVGAIWGSVVDSLLAKVLDTQAAIMRLSQGVFASIMPEAINPIKQSATKLEEFADGLRKRAVDQFDVASKEIDEIAAQLEAAKAERESRFAAQFPDATSLARPQGTFSAAVASLPGFGSNPIDPLLRKLDEHIHVARRIEAGVEKLGFE